MHCLLSEKNQKTTTFLLESELLQLEGLLGEPALPCSQQQAASLRWRRHCVCKAASCPFCLFALLRNHLPKSPLGQQAFIAPVLPAYGCAAAGGWGQIPEGEREAKPPAMQSSDCCGKKPGSKGRMIYWHKLSQYKHLWYRCLCSQILPDLIRLFCKPI